ncbi:MAG: alpha/beta hydrolase, partial [Chitinophagaceae bacterium]
RLHPSYRTISSCMPAGGGVEMINSTSDSLTQSLSSVSADLAAFGMSFNLSPAKPQKEFVSNQQEEKLSQKSCVEITPVKKPSPFAFRKPKGFQGFYNPFDPTGVNHIYYEHTFKYILWRYNYTLQEKEDAEEFQPDKPSFGSYLNGFALMKQHQLKQTISAILRPAGACDSTAANCHFDMTKYIFDADRVVKSDTVSYAKNITPIPDFHDVEYADDKTTAGFDDYEDKSGCNNDDRCLDDPNQLYYFAYYINGIDYENCKYPAIVLTHAGGFSDCSNLKYEDSLCRVLARKGFVVFCVEYRRGRIKTKNKVSAQQQLAAYRACQDIRGALRSIIKRQLRIAFNHFPYQIDTSLIFVAGQSAGALATGTAVYYPKQEMIDSIFPVPPGEIPIDSALGPIDADFYYGDTTIDYRSCIKGFWSMWGGFAFPQSVSDAGRQYDFLTQNGTIPLDIPFIGFQGKLDPVFPIKKQFQSRYYPKSTGVDAPFTIETSCIIDSPFRVYNDNQDPDPDYQIQCSNDIYNILKAHGVPTLMYIDCNMKHGLDNTCDTCYCPTNFGASGTYTKDDVNEYLASRAAFFFQSILNDSASMLLGTSKFISCEDFRFSAGACAIAAHNDGCKGNDTCAKNTEEEYSKYLIIKKN